MGSSVYTPVKSEPSGYQTASSNQVRYLSRTSYMSRTSYISNYSCIACAINGSIFVVLGAVYYWWTNERSWIDPWIFVAAFKHVSFRVSFLGFASVALCSVRYGVSPCLVLRVLPAISLGLLLCNMRFLPKLTLVTGFYCSESANGTSTEELSQRLKLPMDKILYTSSPSLYACVHTETYDSCEVAYSCILLFCDRVGIKSLDDEGLVYSTIDDSHFKKC